ncbi:unnamed protein product [Acanthosepion pharaonis]|uniref:Uncharacterized protein n=1 Tax=Acanthosepion pharaonis TaxID=158019 RepID=A0A812ELV5_ACAPH|nr:unnamed protein product [Sepia pharaonis]
MSATSTVPSDIASTSASTPPMSAIHKYCSFRYSIHISIHSSNASHKYCSFRYSIHISIHSSNASHKYCSFRYSIHISIHPPMSATSTVPSDIASTSASTPQCQPSSNVSHKYCSFQIQHPHQHPLLQCQPQVLFLQIQHPHQHPLLSNVRHKYCSFRYSIHISIHSSNVRHKYCSFRDPASTMSYPSDIHPHIHSSKSYSFTKHTIISCCW